MPDKTARMLFTAYTDFHRPYLRYLNVLLAPYGLTSPHLAVLRRLHDHGPLTLGAWTQMHGVEAPTITALVKKLSATGFVSTGGTETDRRQKIVELTNEGRKIFEQAKQSVDAVTAALLKKFSAQEIESAARLFETMRQKLSALPPRGGL